MKRRMKAMALVMVLGVATVFGSVTAFAEGIEDPIVVEINEETFPDEAFREYVLNGSHNIWDEDNNLTVVKYDANSDGKLSESEISNIPQILVAENGITDMTGLEYFTSIIELQCMWNDIATLDLSKNTELLYLNCYRCQLTGELDLSANTKLDGISAHNNPGLTGIDVSKCEDLVNLSIANTGVTSLDVSNNGKLRSLDCGATGLTALDVSNNPELTVLSCYNTGITSLDVSKNRCLVELECDGTMLESLDVSNNSDLVNLIVSNTPIKGIDLSNNSKLRDLHAIETQLAWLNIGNNPNLKVTAESETAVTLAVPAESFDITEVLPGIDASKITIVSGASIDGNIVSGYDFATPIVYTYDCGNASDGQVVLTVTATLEKATAGDDQNTDNNTDSSTDNSKNTSPSTGDDFAGLMTIAVVAAAGAALVSRRRMAR